MAEAFHPHHYCSIERRGCGKIGQRTTYRGETLMRIAERPSKEAAILARLVGPDEPALSPAAAEAMLTLRFSPADRDRMNDLAAKARAGTLTDDEQAEVEAYSRVSSLLGILNSKARRALKRRSTNGKACRR
jgi:hypothetical protein